MYVSKFISFGVCALLECIGGVAYAFSLYSPALKESLNYTQFEINNIANPFILALIIGLIPGFVFDRLQRHNRFGPRITLLIGASIHFLGYFGLWLVGTHRVENPPYWLVVTMGVLAFNGATWNDVVFVASNIRSFPHERGSAIGVMKALSGLSGSVYAITYGVTMAPDALNFILVVAFMMPIAVLICAPFINAVPFRQPGEMSSEGKFWSNSSRFQLVYSLIIVLSGFCLLASYFDLSTSALSRGLTLAALVVMFSPFMFLWLGSSGFWARPADYCCLPPAENVDVERRHSLDEPLLSNQATLGSLTASQMGLEPDHDGNSEAETASTSYDWPLELTTKQSLSRLNFWMLFLIFGAGSACALLFLMNCGQLVQSLEGPKDGQDPLLSLFSICNCLGRVAFGSLPEWALHNYGTPRCVFLIWTSLGIAVTTFMTGLADVPMLWMTSPIIGLLYGANWSLMPALASEFFGLSHFGVNYCILSTSVGVSSFLVSNILGGYVYQAKAKAHGDQHNICIGSDCFRLTFLIAGCIEVIATVASVVLWRRTAYIYAQELQEIKQEEEVVERHPQTGMRVVRQRHASRQQPSSL